MTTTDEKFAFDSLAPVSFPTNMRSDINNLITSWNSGVGSGVVFFQDSTFCASGGTKTRSPPVSGSYKTVAFDSSNGTLFRDLRTHLPFGITHMYISPNYRVSLYGRLIEYDDKGNRKSEETTDRFIVVDNIEEGQGNRRGNLFGATSKTVATLVPYTDTAWSKDTCVKLKASFHLKRIVISNAEEQTEFFVSMCVASQPFTIAGGIDAVYKGIELYENYRVSAFTGGHFFCDELMRDYCTYNAQDERCDCFTMERSVRNKYAFETIPLLAPCLEGRCGASDVYMTAAMRNTASQCPTVCTQMITLEGDAILQSGIQVLQCGGAKYTINTDGSIDAVDKSSSLVTVESIEYEPKNPLRNILILLGAMVVTVVILLILKRFVPGFVQTTKA